MSGRNSVAVALTFAFDVAPKDRGGTTAHGSLNKKCDTITVLLLLITPPSLIEYFEIQRILGNINRVPRNSGALGEIAREAREKKMSFFGGFTGGNRSKTVQKRFGNIEILIEYFEIGELQKIQLLIEYLGSQIEPAEPPLKG